MNYNDVIVRIAYLTKRNNITQKELADILKIERQSMNGRAERNSEFKDYEIKAIEEYFNINLSSVNISITNKKEYKNDEKPIKEKLSGFNGRLKEVQINSGLSDTDFAKLMGYYRDEYIEFKSGERKPNIKIINELKQHFNISADWILYGE